MTSTSQVPSRSTTASGDAACVDPIDGIGVAAAAQRVGVAASTLRAWERRYGLGPSGRTVGGHRRYSASDVAELQRMRGLIESGMRTASAASLGAAPAERHARATRGGDAADRFSAAVRALTPVPISRASSQLLRERGTVPAWTEVFVPYLQALGQHWATTGTGVEREHLTVAALQTALRAHVLRHAGRARPVQVLAAAVPAEQHTLPLDALAAALAELGVGSCVLYDVPPAALFAAVQHNPNAAVVVWARTRGNVSLLRGLSGLGAVVCAAGPGWRRAKLPPSTTLVTSLAAAVAAVGTNL